MKKNIKKWAVFLEVLAELMQDDNQIIRRNAISIFKEVTKKEII